MSRRKQIKKLIAILSIAALLMPVPVLAQYDSPNYRVDQTFFGVGGELDPSSPNYKAKQTLGELGIGNATSANYQSFAGFNTTDEPYLEFMVTGSNIDLGILDANNASTANGVFTIRAWQTGGYVVRTEADPPSNGTHSLTNLATPTASSPGTEQFGINLVANTSPTTFGADPQQSPDNTFSFGEASSGYDTLNVFKYVKGDTIAESNKSTSITVFTISYLINISNFTPTGQYTFQHDLVATATY